jgi:hypothetical protein
MNTAIELHDSKLVAIERTGSELVITLSPVYVHESEGISGVHPGVGYWQDAKLRLRGAHPVAIPTTLPVDISDGFLAVGAQRWANVVPAPLDLTADCKLLLQLCDGSECEMRAAGVVIELLGAPTNRENFSGA